ncbi:hypothetical protein GRF29_8g2193075, partial [Pseudopithomyces chartarum]
MAPLTRTLPASWYCSSPLYQLERRAVFLKSWYLLGPLTRFHTVGEEIDYEMAGVPLSACRMSEDIHDIKVINKETRENMRFYTTETGLLFSTISDEAPSFDEFFPELKPLINTVDFTKLPYRRSIKYEGRFNWKTMVDGYQECLHCQYTHPSFSLYYPPTFYTVYNHKNFCQHVADPKKPHDGLFLYFFPNCTLNVYGGGMSSFRVCPTDKPGVTRMEFDYYNLETGDKFEEYFNFVRTVAMEDYELCEKAQENLEKGVYSEGILNPEKETGVAYYQQQVLDMHVDERVGRLDRAEHMQTALKISQRIASKTALSCCRPQLTASWLCVTHCSRFAKPGDYISLALADFTILLILSKDKIVRAFHNVCRHRAYAVTKKAAGSSLVLRCRYHGWTYDSKGKLLKAPHFDEIDGFDKSENSLFSIHTCTDRAGFVYISLDAERDIQPPNLKGLQNLALETGLRAGSKWLTGWSLNGAFNWKVFSSYDHQYAVSTSAPPSLVSLLPRIFYNLFRKSHFSTANCKTSAWAPGSVVFTFRSSPLWATATALPVSATQTTLQLEVFSTADLPLEEITVKNLKAFFEAYVGGLER